MWTLDALIAACRTNVTLSQRGMPEVPIVNQRYLVAAECVAGPTPSPPHVLLELVGSAAHAYMEADSKQVRLGLMVLG